VQLPLRLGHVNGRSGIGFWPFGEFLLDRLINSLRWPPLGREPAFMVGFLRSAEIALAVD
jgi:hypothetical protein